MTATSTTDPEADPTLRKRRGRLIAFIAIVVVVVAGASTAYLLIHNAIDPHEANAGRVAQEMLAAFTPPAGATPVSDTPKLNGVLTGPSPEQQVNRVKRWHLTGDAMTVAQGIAAHPPEGYKLEIHTPMKTGSGIIYVWFRPTGKTNPALNSQGIREQALDLSLVNVDDHTVALLAQTSVNWARSRGSNTKIPTGAKRLVVTKAPDDSAQPASVGVQPRTVTRVEDINEISRLLNSLDPGPDSTYVVDCIGHPETDYGTFRLSFGTPTDDHATTAVVDTTGCRWVGITINGQNVGTFWGSDQLSTALQRLYTGQP